MEEGHNWFWTIRNMEDTFFKDAFGEFMVNPQASTEQEINSVFLYEHIVLQFRKIFIRVLSPCKTYAAIPVFLHILCPQFGKRILWGKVLCTMRPAGYRHAVCTD